MEDVKRTILPGKAVVVDGNDIDTDRIIPARYLRAISFDGLGEHAFADDRKALAATGELHPFDEPLRQEARILVVGRNFGCGSSREHAPQALMRWGAGLTAIVGESFSEIFFGNCVALGIPCVTATPDRVEVLADAVKADATLEVTVDLTTLEARFGEHCISVNLPDGARRQLMSGRWDSTSELLAGRAKTLRVASALPYFGGWS